MTSNGGTLADRLRRIRVGVRQDLQVTRHLFQGEPAYVVCDPMTFQSHRLDPTEYAIFVAIDQGSELAAIFEDLVERGTIEREFEESFYQFVFALHRFNFLNLPVSDEKLLYERHVARKRARRREKLMGFLFIRVPLIHPDAFLERTMKYARFLFTHWFFAVWVGLMTVAGYVGVTRADQLALPLQGVLLATNLPLLWAVLVVLKVFHEFGHAYACKHFGGYVPEMGAYFIIFTPCAYVDASAAWSFTRKRERIIVCLGGMYVESLFAAAAMLVWAAASPGVVRDLAYNVIFLAGLVTILFNINPLLRYDGYYIFSDLVEIPNLRQRSTQYVMGLLKRLLLGLRSGAKPVRRRTGLLLFGYGVAAISYRLTMMFGIALLVASKFFVVGMGLAVMLVFKYVVGAIRKLLAYLWYAEETAPVRFRALAVSLLVLVGVPLFAMFVPVRSHIVGRGVLRLERETPIRAGADGIVSSIGARGGDHVGAGDVIVTMENDGFDDGIAGAQSRMQVSEIVEDAYAAIDAGKAVQERERRGAIQDDLASRLQKRAELVASSPRPGLLVDGLHERDLGRFVKAGELVGTLVEGDWEARALLTEEQVDDAGVTVGSTVEVRAASAPGQSSLGIVRTIAPAGTRRVEIPALTHIGGGEIAVDPATQEAAQSYVEVIITLADADDSALRSGMTCKVRFTGPAQPIGRSILRRAIRLADNLLRR